MPDCLSMSPAQSAQKLAWLPESCAYRRLAHGQSLPLWHPLISGDPRSVQRAGIGMQGRCRSETMVPLELWVERVIEFHD